MANKILETENLTIQFGGLKAVDNLNFHIYENELFGLIGPNGAGKTTVFNLLTGVYKPTHGSIRFLRHDTSLLKPWDIAKLGMSRTFQNIRLFKDLTVLENVQIGCHKQITYGLISSIIKSKKFLQQEDAIRKKCFDLLEIFSLEKKSGDLAGSLPYGEQRKLEIVRALATSPKLICLDEPAAGMNHQETHQLMETIAKIRKDFKLTVLLIEHDMKLVMGICERILVLDHGVKIEEGTAKQIQSSKKVIEAYLGPEGELA